MGRPGAHAWRERAPVTTLLAGLVLATGPGAAGAQPAPIPDSVRRAVAERLAGVAVEFGLAFRDLGTGSELLVHPDVRFHAASTMKVPVMVRLFRMADGGVLSMDDSLLVTNRFRSILDGSPYRLSPEDDSDSELYRRVGEKVPLGELVHRMIARSSNLATNELIRVAGPDSIAVMLRELGAGGMEVLRGVEDIPAFRQGLNNTTTARGLLELLTALARYAAARPASTRAMIDILAAQEFNEAIPAGLPAGWTVAHKTGWISGIVHDAAIVVPPDGAPWVLVVLTRGETPADEVRRAIADVSRILRRWLASARVGGEGGERSRMPVASPSPWQDRGS